MSSPQDVDLPNQNFVDFSAAVFSFIFMFLGVDGCRGDKAELYNLGLCVAVVT